MKPSELLKLLAAAGVELKVRDLWVAKMLAEWHLPSDVDAANPWPTPAWWIGAAGDVLPSAAAATIADVLATAGLVPPKAKPVDRNAALNAEQVRAAARCMKEIRKLQRRLLDVGVETVVIGGGVSLYAAREISLMNVIRVLAAELAQARAGEAPLWLGVLEGMERHMQRVDPNGLAAAFTRYAPLNDALAQDKEWAELQDLFTPPAPGASA